MLSKRTPRTFLSGLLFLFLLFGFVYPSARSHADATSNVQVQAPFFGPQRVVDRLDDPSLPAGSACTNSPDDCSLRGAVSGSGSGDLITFGVTGTITLTNGEIGISSGNLTIMGPGTSGIAVSGGNSSRIFSIAPGLEIYISGLTLRDGSSAQGGAIFNDRGTLHLEDCTLASNTASESGGAVYSSAVVIAAQSGPGPSASLTITNCTLEGNSASGMEDDLDGRLAGDLTGTGGAVYNYALGAGATAVVTITHSTFLGNTADDDFYAGGAVVNFAYNVDAIGTTTAEVSIDGSEFIGNQAPSGDGGALVNYALDRGTLATLTLNESTLSENSSGSDFGGGGAIFNYSYNRDADGLATATVNLSNSTLNANSAVADRGGGLFNGALDSGSRAVTNLVNSTLSGNSAAAQGGGLANDGYNRDAFGLTEAFYNLTNVTLVGNNAFEGGGLSNIPVSALGTTVAIQLKNSIVLNSGGGDCINSGTVGGANNLIDDISCGSGSPFRIGAPALVDLVLKDNGGPTLTHALFIGSNTEDAIPTGDCTVVNTSTLVDRDQRGATRPIGPNCDVGSVEGTTDPPSFPFGLYLPVILR